MLSLQPEPRLQHEKWLQKSPSAPWFTGYAINTLKVYHRLHLVVFVTQGYSLGPKIMTQIRLQKKILLSNVLLNIDICGAACHWYSGLCNSQTELLQVAITHIHAQKPNYNQCTTPLHALTEPWNQQLSNILPALLRVICCILQLPSA